VSEYAIFKDRLVKLGTSSHCYYIRYEDRQKVHPLPNNIDYSNDFDLYFRLPYPSEDSLKIGEYQDPDRVYMLHGFAVERADRHAGMIQLNHESGLHINIVCYHGLKLPNGSKEMVSFWNHKESFFALCAIKNTQAGLKAVVRCKFCGKSWATEIDNVLSFIFDRELKRRLEAYKLL
jgi:hypothetical protein